MTTQILLLFIGAVLSSSVLTALLGYLLNKGKIKLENGLMRIELKDKQDASILRLEKEIIGLKRAHDECEQRGYISEIELSTLKRYVRNRNIEDLGFKVFVLDDVDYVLFEYAERLKRVSVIEVVIFDEIGKLEAELHQKPEVLILDYRVHGLTIEKLVKKIISLEEDYKPKIIVISGIKEEDFEQLPISKDIWKFVTKDDGYVNKSINMVMSFIEQSVKF